MGGRRRAGAAAAGVVLALAQGAGAATVSEPLARFGLEERYDQDLVATGGGASTLLQPSLGWRLRDPTTVVEAAYAADLYMFGGYGDARLAANHRLEGEQRFALDRGTTLVLRQGGERVFDPTALSRPGVPRTASEVTYLEGDAAVDHRLARRLSAGAGYRIERAWFDEEAAVDGTVHAPRGSLTYRVGRRDDASARYRLQVFDVDRGADGLSHEPSVAWRRRLLALTHLELEAGPSIHAEQEGAYRADPRGRALLVHERRHVTFQASLERVLVGAAGFPGAVWADTAFGLVTWRPAAPLTLSGGVGAYRNLSAPAQDEVAKGIGAEVKARFHLGDGFVAHAALRHVTQEDRSGIGVDLSRNIFAAGVGWQLDPALPQR